MGIEAVVIGGAILGAYGSYQSAKAEAEASNMNASLKEAQAREVLRRAEINEADIVREGDKLLGKQAAVQAGLGGSVSSGNLVLAQAEANYSILREIITNQDEAMFQAQQIRAGAQMDRRLASETKKAGFIKAGTTLLTGAYKYSQVGE